MSYIVLIVIFLFVLGVVEKKTFRWETVVRHLWKVLYVKADNMTSHMKQFNISDSEEPGLGGFKAQIEIRGKLINSILDYINDIRDETEYDKEEETFGYGRYDFGTVLNVATTNPDYFKKFK